MGLLVSATPELVDRAAAHLAGARTAAEILDARDHAAVAYDMARRAGRLAAARGAYDELIPRIHRAQADALVIEAEAKRRLADEYDAATASRAAGSILSLAACASAAAIVAVSNMMVSFQDLPGGRGRVTGEGGSNAQRHAPIVCPAAHIYRRQNETPALPHPYDTWAQDLECRAGRKDVRLAALRLRRRFMGAS